MIVVVEGEGEVKDVAQGERLLCRAFGHAPADHIMRLLPSPVIVSRDGAQLEVLFFEDARGLHQPGLTADEYRQRIARAVGLQLLKRLPECPVNRSQRQFVIVFEHRNEVGGREPLPGEGIEAGAQFGQALNRQGTADGMGVSPEAGEEFGTALQRLQQMEGRDGAARAMRLSVYAGEDQRRTMVALDHAGGADADDAAMPTFASDHLAVGVA